jgi:Domain of unknown function (DUF4296)
MNRNKYRYKIRPNILAFTFGRPGRYLFFVLFLLTSCSNKEKIPKDILPKEKMQAVLWSMINAGEFLNGYVLKDSVDKETESSKVYGQVFQIHRISKEEFDKSYSYYRQHPELMKVILDSLSKRQTFANEQGQKKQDSMQKKLDTIPKKILREAEAN